MYDFSLKASHGKDFDKLLGQCVKNPLSDCLELSFPRLSGKFMIIGNVTLVQNLRQPQTRLVNNLKGCCDFRWQVIPGMIIKWESCSDLGNMKREEKRAPVLLCVGVSSNGWSYWRKASGSPERSNELVVRGVQRAQGKKTDKEKEQKHFRYLTRHWTITVQQFGNCAGLAPQGSNAQRSVDQLILLVMMIKYMNDAIEVPWHLGG